MGDTHLTAREVQVLRLIAVGHANAKIARELHLSINTVKSHVSRMAQRVGARDRAALVAVGIRARVVAVGRTPGVSLDPAEQRLVDLVAQGLYTAEIARQLKVSGPSATYRVQLLMARLGAVDRAHMVLRAAEVGAWPVRPVAS